MNWFDQYSLKNRDKQAVNSRLFSIDITYPLQADKSKDMILRLQIITLQVPGCREA